MELEKFNNLTKNIRKGAYTKIKYVSNGKDNTYKVVDTIIRFIEYKPITTTTKLITTPKIKLGRFAIDGKNGAYTQLYLSKSPKHKAKTIYFNGDGIEISKVEYEKINQTKPITNTQGIFSKRIADIISIGKAV